MWRYQIRLSHPPPDFSWSEFLTLLNGIRGDDSALAAAFRMVPAPQGTVRDIIAREKARHEREAAEAAETAKGTTP
jgi:hypothetical protein